MTELTYGPFVDQVTLSTAPVLIQPDETIKNNLDVSFLTIEKGHLIAKNVLFRDLIAKDLEADFILTHNGVLNINELNFKVAEGMVNSTASYNFKNGEHKCRFYMVLTFHQTYMKKLRISMLKFV